MLRTVLATPWRTPWTTFGEASLWGLSLVQRSCSSVRHHLPPHLLPPHPHLLPHPRPLRALLSAMTGESTNSTPWTFLKAYACSREPAQVTHIPLSSECGPDSSGSDLWKEGLWYRRETSLKSTWSLYPGGASARRWAPRSKPSSTTFHAQRSIVASRRPLPTPAAATTTYPQTLLPSSSR